MAAPSNPLLRFLDATFLWLPNDRSPGFAAVALFLLRQVTLPFVLVFAPGVLLMLIARTGPGRLLDTAAMPPWLVFAIPTALWGCVALVQELSRFAFVRHADRPLRSLTIFTGVVAGAIVLFEHDRLWTPLWMIAAQLAAGAALFFGLRRRAFIPLILAAIILGQTIIDVTAPRLFPAPETHGPGAASAPAAASAQPPAVGGMDAWAKVYPGASVTRSETSTLLGMTTWKVEYKTGASAQQIAAFYQSIATTEGFKENAGFGGFHSYKQESTNRDFSFGVVSEAGQSEVAYQSRAFDKP